jgi:hypothetical protein
LRFGLVSTDITRLRSAGYDRAFTSLEDGIRQLCELVKEEGSR